MERSKNLFWWYEHIYKMENEETDSVMSATSIEDCINECYINCTSWLKTSSGKAP